MERLPLFKLVIDESADAGVSAVALVDQPAIEVNWQTFSKEKPVRFEVENAEQRIISGPLMIPDLPIFRKADGERPDHMVIFDKETIKSIVFKFSRKGNFNAVNMMHEASSVPEGVFMFETFITDSARGISAPDKFKELPEGTWFGSYKVDNEEVWNDFIATGLFKGFSVEGLFKYESPSEPTEEEKILQSIEYLLDMI